MVSMEYIPIVLHDDLTDVERDYIQHLYDRTVPCYSAVFPDDPCLVWTGAKSDKYARHKPPGKKGSPTVHRYIYELVYKKTVGPLGKRTVDHICSREDCINLRHLRLLSRELNKELGDHRRPEVIQPRLNKYE